MFSGGHCCGKGTDHRDQCAIKGEFTKSYVGFGDIGWDDFKGSEKGDRDGQIKMLSDFGKVCRR